MILQLEQAKLSLGELSEGINDLGDSIGYESLKKEVEELENKTAEAGFWDKPQESQVVLKQLKFKKGTLERYLALRRSFDDIETLIELSIEEDDDSVVEDVLSDLEAVRKEYDDFLKDKRAYATELFAKEKGIEYTLVIKYQYDLHDGKGMNIVDKDHPTAENKIKWYLS